MNDTESTFPETNGGGPGLAVSEAAAVLGISEDTVRAHLRQGTLPGEKLGNRWVVRLAEPPRPASPRVTDSDRLLAEGLANTPAPRLQRPPAHRRIARRAGALWRRARGLVTTG